VSHDCNCREFLIGKYAEMGIEVAVSPWTPAIIPTTYEPLNMRCPHGVKWHAEPTTDQQAEWARGGVL
jgi:hypothetical protein